MTERDFVLNNFFVREVNYNDRFKAIEELKEVYKLICENTSEDNSKIIEMIEKLKGN